jgi:hypothetical protein
MAQGRQDLMKAVESQLSNKCFATKQFQFGTISNNGPGFQHFFAPMASKQG